MAKITRKTQKIFCSNATNNQIAAMGSMKTGTPVYTTDLDAIQTTEYTQGWDSCIKDDKAPYMEEMNAMQYTTTRQLAYLFQSGIAEYDENTTYYQYSFCQKDGVIYISQTNDNIGNDVEDTTYWKELKTSGYHPPILSCMWSDHIINDIQWLRADTFSWQSGDVYKTVYDKLVEEYATGAEETYDDGLVFKRTTSGFRITTADYEDLVLTRYNQTGNRKWDSWFYILDTTNKRFKLPRTKWGFKGLRTNVGDDIAESLPNIKAEFKLGSNTGLTGSTGTSGAFYITGTEQTYGLNGTSNATFNKSLGFDASRSSSTYQDNAPVQERATQMYLYFYVGEYAQSAVEQTAGLNAELFNNKMDRTYNNATYQPVNKTGDTMTGDLIISGDTTRQCYIKNTSFDRAVTTAPDATNFIGLFKTVDKNNKVISAVQTVHRPTNNIQTEIVTQREVGGVLKGETFIVGLDANGKPYYNKPQIITDYVSGTSGYRIWSNGYCEQWGRYGSTSSGIPTITVSFAKTFANANYNLSLTCDAQSVSYSANKFSASVAFGNGANGYTNISWRAFGYLASGQY